MIAKCKAKCNNAGQDELHGPGLRVMNHRPKKPPQGDEWYACTVCGTRHLPFEVGIKQAATTKPKGKGK